MATNGKAASATAGALQLSNLIKAYAMSAPWQMAGVDCGLFAKRRPSPVSWLLAFNSCANVGAIEVAQAGCTESLLVAPRV